MSDNCDLRLDDSHLDYLTSLGTKEGYALLGKRYARQAKALIDKEKPADNGRPE